jgi:hypothetical protein
MMSGKEVLSKLRLARANRLAAFYVTCHDAHIESKFENDAQLKAWLLLEVGRIDRVTAREFNAFDKAYPYLVIDDDTRTEWDKVNEDFFSIIRDCVEGDDEFRRHVGATDLKKWFGWMIQDHAKRRANCK